MFMIRGKKYIGGNMTIINGVVSNNMEDNEPKEYNCDNQIIEANHSLINGNGNTIIGNHNTIIGNNNNITGNHNKITGHNNKGTGNHNKFDGANNYCMGNHNKLAGTASGATGNYNKINNQSNTLIINEDIVINGNTTVNYSSPYIIKEKEKVKEVKYIGIPTTAELEHDIVIPENSDIKACSICLSKIPNCVILPCMHKILCVECSIELGGKDCPKERCSVNCPECRKSIKDIKRVFE